MTGLDILVVEDAPELLDVLTTLLRIEGADVAGVANARDALTVFHRGRFDVVVTDLGLPDMPGDVLIRSLIAAAPLRGLTVIVISGEDERALSRARAAGAAEVFAKPCEWESVIAYLAGLSLAPAA